MEVGHGERITGEGELGVKLLVDIEQLGVASVRWEPGGGIAPPLHVHARHAECFLVLEGELTFHLQDRELRANAGTCTLVPAGVVHSFTVTGDSSAHFLDIHVPSCGFGDFVRNLYSASTEDEQQEARAVFDQVAPEHATGNPGLVVFRHAGGGEGDTLTNRPGRRATVLVESDEITISEFDYGAGERGAQRHVHREHTDAFLVVDGEFTFHFRDGSRALPAGTLLVMPPNVVHGFDNDSDASARCFNFHVPSFGFADYMRGTNPDFDQFDPPENGADSGSAIVTRLG